jgi:hypothetical protein
MDRLGNTDQLALVTRGEAIDIRVCRGLSLALISPADEGGTTSELDNVAAASEGIGLHGGSTFLPTRDVEAPLGMG